MSCFSDITAIGAFERVTLGFFELQKQGVQENPNQRTGRVDVARWEHRARY
jgi:hypothetical protein